MSEADRERKKSFFFWKTKAKVSGADVKCQAIFSNHLQSSWRSSKSAPVMLSSGFFFLFAKNENWVSSRWKFWSNEILRIFNANPGRVKVFFLLSQEQIEFPPFNEANSFLSRESCSHPGDSWDPIQLSTFLWEYPFLCLIRAMWQLFFFFRWKSDETVAVSCRVYWRPRKRRK